MLGPLIFLVAILETSEVMMRVRKTVKRRHNQQLEGMEMRTICFADDTTLVCSAEDDIQLEILMRVCSEEYTKYFKVCGMKINKDKEEHYVILPGGTKIMDREIEIDGRKPAETVKLLGLTIGPRYSFDHHVSKSVQKVSMKLAHVRRLRKILSDKKMKEVTESLIMSTLKFGLEWSARTDNNMKRLQVMMNQVLRLLTKSGRQMSIRLMLVRTDMMNIALEAKMMRMTLMKRVLSMGSTPLTNSYVIFPGHRSRSGDLRSRLPSGKFGQSSILNISIELLNSVNFWKMKDDEGKYPSKQVFKTKVKEFLKANFSNGNL